MKKQILILFIFISQFSAITYAESAEKSEGTISPNLLDEVNLSADQKKILRESFLKNQKNKIQLQSEKAILELDLKNAYSANPVNKTEITRIGEKIGETDKKMTQLKVESWGHFLSTLTPEQHQRVNDFQAKNRNARKEIRSELKAEIREEKHDAKRDERLEKRKERLENKAERKENRKENK